MNEKVRLRLIDQIWTDIAENNLLEVSDITDLVLTLEGYNELADDYMEEFYQDSVNLKELQDYLGLNILIKNDCENGKYKIIKKEDE